ncbi:uncharacterized protein LOC135692278 [Rhopilema esculentum]|uniref:uncharacterized protein LOC135692278 n=1 Tax=Rhopilema esculentum TaxID=499914 RepID=UPI0031DB56EA
MDRCVKDENGRLGFRAFGDVVLMCAEDTCGPKGKAEFWCEECCRTSTTFATKIRTLAWRNFSTSTARSVMNPSSDPGISPGYITVACVVGFLVLATIIAITVYWKKQKKQKKRERSKQNTLPTQVDKKMDGEYVIQLNGQVVTYQPKRDVTTEPIQATPDDNLGPESGLLTGQ